MRRFVTTEDIRELAEVGEFELMVREGTVLTDAALDEAHRLGVRLVEGSRLAAPRPPAADGLRPVPSSGAPPPVRSEAVEMGDAVTDSPRATTSGRPTT